MKKGLIYIIGFIFVGLLWECDPDPCQSSGSVILKANFYTHNNQGQEVDTVMRNVIVTGLDCLPDSCYRYYPSTNGIQVYLSSIYDSSSFEIVIDTFYNYLDTAFHMTRTVFDDSIHKDIISTIDLDLDSIFDFVYIESTDTGTVYDSIIFHYTRHTYMESPECGVYIDFNLSSFTYSNHLIDTIILINPAINSQGLENIRIYY